MHGRQNIKKHILTSPTLSTGLKHEDERIEMSAEDLKAWSETSHDINFLIDFAKL